MRINRYVAQSSGLSRRAADKAIADGRVKINDLVADLGQVVGTKDVVTLNNEPLKLQPLVTIVLNKPVGYVCSRFGQGNKTVYDLLPPELHNLKPVGRLDKDSSGLLLMTNDGDLANLLAHPSSEKQKVYEVGLDKALSGSDHQQIESGVQLEDGPSKLQLKGSGTDWTVTMSEGRNRQIRRTFAALNYTVNRLHRLKVGSFELRQLKEGHYLQI